MSVIQAASVTVDTLEPMGAPQRSSDRQGRSSMLRAELCALVHAARTHQRSGFQDLPDEELLALYQAGNTPAFDVLFFRYQARVYNFVRRMVRDRSTAEDLTQDVFLRVAAASRRYRAEASISTWIFTIARNLCIDWRRKARYRRTTVLFADVDEEVANLNVVAARSPGLAADQEVHAAQIGRALSRAINSLPEEQREVFLLRELAGLSFEDVAVVAGCPRSTAKSRMRYALHHLRRKLRSAAVVAGSSFSAR